MDKQTESRSQFEEWATKRSLQLDKDKDAWGREKYKYHMIQALWDGWQASRESLVVELPQRQSLRASGYGDGYFVPNDFGEGLEYDETVEAIRAIGIRIKGEGI